MAVEQAALFSPFSNVFGGSARPSRRDVNANGLDTLFELIAAQAGGNASVIESRRNRAELTVLHASGTAPRSGSRRDELLAIARHYMSGGGWASPGSGDAGDALLALSASAGEIELILIAICPDRTPRYDVDIETIEKLLAAAATLVAERAAESGRLTALNTALDCAPQGLVLVDAARRIVLSNATARTMLAGDNGLRCSGTALCASHLADTMRLQSVIDHLAGGGDSETIMLAMRRDQGRRPLILAVRPVEHCGDEDGRAVASITIVDPEESLGSLIDPVCRLYGMTPVEARVASLLTEGRSLAEVAKQLRLRDATARGYLKQIFAKTGIRRQAELVALMLRSCVRGVARRSDPALSPAFEGARKTRSHR